MSLSALALTGKSRVPLVGAGRLRTRHAPVITLVEEIVIIVGLVFLPIGLPHSGDLALAGRFVILGAILIDPSFLGSLSTLNN